MRSIGEALFVFILLAAPAAFAQVDGGGIDNMDGISDGCGATMNADECMFGDSGWNDISQCTRTACPACAFDETGTKSICYYLTGNSGYCSCKGRDSVGRDSHGNIFPNCSTSGSCLSHR